MGPRPLLGWLAAAILGSLPVVGGAGTFSISPVRVELSQGAGSAALTIRNEEQAPVVVQATALAWDQGDGQDTLTPTRDVLVSPAVVTIPPGGSQLIRVALRRPVDPARELTYRLLLDEVPPVAKPDFNGLRVALRLSLPIFVAPITRAKPELEWSASRTPDGDLAVTLRNSGRAHVQVRSFTVAPGGTPGTTLQQSVPGYVLPDRSRTWTLPTGATVIGEQRSLRVSSLTDAGDMSADIRLTDP